MKMENHNKLIGCVFENGSGNKRKRIEQIDGNQIIYSSSKLVKGKWSAFKREVFCCATLSDLEKWGNKHEA